MPKYFIRLRVQRVHHFIIEAEDMEAAQELAEDLDEGNSSSDTFDSQEVLDITLETDNASQA